MILSSGCGEKKSIVNIQINWKSSDPQSIPLTIREKEYEKQNLLLNPSFEMGRILTYDTVLYSYNISGWSTLGENVYWTDIRNESAFKKDEAYHGFQSIKIVREKADETDVQGEGVVSDFIKVIPGNYRLTCYIKLQNIESNLKRLTGNLLDAVNIRLFYYDKNKILIKSSVFNPASDNIIDNSFKAYSFSGFDYISELPWTKINCISNHFPFEEGGIPSEARFVKVFFGLKGTGTMWVDLADYRYSSANFSLLEKCGRFFEAGMEPSQMLIPTPFSFTNYKQFELSLQTENKEIYPLIYAPRNMSEKELKAVKTIKSILEEAIAGKISGKGAKVNVVTRLHPDELESGRLIFSIGSTSILSENAEHLPFKELKEHPQSYLISRPESYNNLVIIYSEDPEGYFYASRTINQLIDHSNAVYNHYDIFDYPAFINRSFVFKTDGKNNPALRNDLLHALSLGFNKIFVKPSDDLSFQSVYSFYSGNKQYFSSVWKEFPYFRYGFSGINIMMDDKRFDFTESNKPLTSLSGKVEVAAERLARIVKQYDPVQEEGLIISDIFLWEYLNLGSPSTIVKLFDADKFNQFIELRNLFFNTLGSLLSSPDYLNYIYFLPVFSDNSLLHKSGAMGRYYFKDFYFNEGEPDILLWKGPAEYSFSIDGAELKKFNKETEKKIIWFDNTLSINKENRMEMGVASIYPGKAKLGSLFAPFDVILNADINDFHNRECIVDLSDFSPASLIRLSTAADFLWNPDSYNPELSLWKVLVARYGRESAISLLHFNDACYKLLGITITAEADGLSQRLLREGEEVIRSVNLHWEELMKLIEKDTLFINQLADKKNQIITRFYQSKRKRVTDKITSAE